MALVYEELIDFIAGGPSVADVAAYQPTETARSRVFELIAKEKDETITSDERSELDLFMQLEHLMRMAKAKARGNAHRGGAA